MQKAVFIYGKREKQSIVYNAIFDEADMIGEVDFISNADSIGAADSIGSPDYIGAADSIGDQCADKFRLCNEDVSDRLGNVSCYQPVVGLFPFQNVIKGYPSCDCRIGLIGNYF